MKMKQIYVTFVVIILKITAVISYFCYFDKCILDNKQNKTINYQFPDSARILEYKLAKSDLNYSLYVNTQLKQIETRNTVAYRGCINKTKFTEYSKITYNPTNRPIKRTMGPKFIFGKKRLPFEYCLFSHCFFEIYKDKKALICFYDHISNLSVNFIDKYCASGITYMHIRSSNLNKIGNESAFFNNKLIWNIVYLKIEMSKNETIRIECNSFQYLKQLRVLELNVIDDALNKFNCIFNYNPNLVKITSQGKRIWNMCNEQTKQTNVDNTNYFNLYLLLILIFVIALSILLIIALRFKKIW